MIPELLKIVDDTMIYDKRSILTLGITTAVELSYLTKEEQNEIRKLIAVLEKQLEDNDKRNI